MATRFCASPQGASGLSLLLRKLSDDDLETIRGVLQRSSQAGRQSAEMLAFFVTLGWLCKQEWMRRQQEVVELDRLYFLH